MTTKCGNSSAWTMTEEIAFLNQLGTFADSPMTRAELLAGYLEGLRARDPKKLGHLHAKQLENHAIALLNGELMQRDLAEARA